MSLWFWGNLFNDKFIPTISDTLFNASGVYALQGIFGGSALNPTRQPPYTSIEAGLNILVIGLCAVAALFGLNLYLVWQAKRV